MMNLHYLQHVPFEGPANILSWAEERGYHVTSTKLHRREPPPPTDFDLLVVMGGPMGVHDEHEYPWLAEEKEVIQRAIENDIRVLGICPGAQLIANVLGADVYKNDYREIGWFPVERTKQAKTSPVFGDLPEEYMAFHWHGDTFDLPEGATRMATSDACRNQAYVYGKSVVGLQFHLECTGGSITDIVSNSEPGQGAYVQSKEKLLSGGEHLDDLKRNLYTLLDNLSRV